MPEKDLPPTETLECLRCLTAVEALIGRQAPARCIRCGMVVERPEPLTLSDASDTVEADATDRTEAMHILPRVRRSS